MPPPLRQASSFRNPAGFVLFLAFSCCFDIVGASVTLFNVANFSVETPILQIDVPLVTPTYDTSSNNVTYYTCDFPRFSGSYDEDLVLLDLPLKDPPSTCVLDVEKLKADAQGSADVAAQLARGFGLLINWNAPKMQGCRRYAQLMKQIADYSISNSISPFQLRAALFTALQTTRTDIGFPFVTPYGDLSDLIPGPVYYGLIAADDGAELSRRLNGQKVGPVFVRLTGETGMWSFLITTSSSYFWGQSVCLLLLVIAALYAVYQLFLISRNSNRDHWKVRSAIHVAGLGYSIVCAISSLVPLNLLDAKVGLSFFWTSTYFQFSASNLLLFLWSSIASSIQKHTEFRVRIFRRLCFSCHALFILMTVCLIAGPDIHDFTLLRVGFNLIFIVMPAIFVIQALIFGYLAFTLISGRRLNQLSESTTITTRTIVILSFVSMLGNILLTLSAILDGLWATLTVPGYIAQMAIRQVAYVILFGAVSAGHKLRWEDGDGEEKDVGNGGWKRLWSMSKRAKPNHLETKIGMFPDAKKSAQKSKWSVIIDGDTTMYLDSGGAKVTEFGPGRISIASPRRSIDLDFAYQQLAKASSSVMASDRTADRELDPMSKGNNLPYGKASIRMSSRSTPEMNEEVDPLDTSFGETDDPPMLPDDINEGGSLSRLAKSLPQPPKANGKRARIRPPIPSPFLDQVRGARESAPVNVFDESRNSRNLFPRDSTMAIQIPSLKCLNRSVDLPGFPEDEDVLPQRSFRVLDTGILPLSALTENLPVALSQGNMRRSTYLSGNPPFARLTTAISADAEEKNWREDPPSPSKDNVPLGNPLSTYRGSIRLEPIHGIAIPHKRST